MRITAKYRKDLEANYPIGAIAYGTVKDGQNIEVEITQIGGYNERGYVSISFTNKELNKSWRCDAETFKERFKITKMPKPQVEEEIPQSIIDELMPKVDDYLVSICDAHPHFYKVVDVSKARVKVKSIASCPTSYDENSGNQRGMCMPDILNNTPDDCNIWDKGYARDGGVWIGYNPAQPKNGIITCSWKVEKDKYSRNNEPHLSIWKGDIFSLVKWDGQPVAWSSID